MATSVKISDNFANIAREEAQLQHRSLAGQVEHWAALGRYLESSGVFDPVKVRAALKAELSVNELTAEERVLHEQTLFASLESLDGKDVRLLEKLRKKGAVIWGIDEEGKLRNE